MWLKLGSDVRNAYTEKHFTYEYAPRQPGYMYAAYTMFVIITLLTLGHVYAPNSFYGHQSVVIYVVYTPACLAAWLSIWRFLWHCDEQSAIQTWRLGIVGGGFGILNLVWPLLFPSHLYHLLSRTADSVLYVPLVLGAVSRMDDEMWAAVLRFQASLLAAPIVLHLPFARLDLKFWLFFSNVFNPASVDLLAPLWCW